MFEFFLCPVHGIFRPDNIALMYQSVYLCLLSAKTYYDRFFGGF